MSVPLMTPRAMREQSAFRALIAGMARPGTIHRVAAANHPAPFGTGIALVEALLDHEVSFAVCPANPDAEEVLLRLTGSHLQPPSRADYVLAVGEGVAAALTEAQRGDPEYPDRGATVIAMVEAISGEPEHGEELVLSGPGIRERQSVWVAGFAPAHRRAFAACNSDLPLGVDLVLAALDGSFLCLPRYTRIQEGI